MRIALVYPPPWKIAGEGESAQVLTALRGMGLGNVRLVEASTLFLGRLDGISDPEAQVFQTPQYKRVGAEYEGRDSQGK